MSYAEQLSQLHAILYTHRAYWQFAAFEQPLNAWHNTQLNAYLEQLSEDELSQLEQGDIALSDPLYAFFPPLRAWLEAHPLTCLSHTALELPSRLLNGVKGRKAEQIIRFAQQLKPSERYLEWCAGKGHLGRLVGHLSHKPITSIEWQSALCEQGRQLATQQNIAQDFVCADVLSANNEAKTHLCAQQHALALHACGELHRQLIRQASEAQCAQLSICPCCYHLGSDKHYAPLSLQAQSQPLKLQRRDLRLAVQQCVTGGERVARLRHIESQWRLAYQALRETLTGNTQYQPLNSVSKQVFNQGDAGFIAFCQWACAEHHLSRPQHIDYAHYLAQGALRYRRVRELEVVRRLFSRPIERYLCLDLALYLEARAYRVRIHQLFEHTLSPRNILLQAEKIA